MKPLVEPKQVVSEQSAARVLERGRDLAKLAVPRVIRVETWHQKVTVTIDVDFDGVGCCGCVAVDGEAWSGEAAWRVVDAGNGLHPHHSPHRHVLTMLSHVFRFTCLVGSHVALAASCALFIASVKLARAGEAHGR